MFAHQYPAGFTGCVSKAGLGIGSTADELSTTSPNGAGFDYAIKGIAYHKAESANIDDVPLVLSTQAADTTCLYLVQINAAGTLSVVKGEEVLNTDLVAGNKVLHWPRPTSDDYCPVGAFKVKTVAVTFTAGTTNLDADGVTDTYYDFIGGMPSAPLTS